MTHQFIHACAGAGKTEHIVRVCSNPENSIRRLVITLTESGQEELITRLSLVSNKSAMPDVMGWYSFLIQHYVRPYLPLVFPGVRPTGFIFDRASHPKEHYRLSGPRRYFSGNLSIYKESLPELATKVAETAEGNVENRLSQIYDEIIIDEAQDLSRKSLDIVARLLERADLRLLLVGDVRQSLLDSDQMSSRNRSADRLGLMKWYREHEKAGRLTIEELYVTKRSNQMIADFSDLIFPSDLSLIKTKSSNQITTGHDGIFLVHEDDLDYYLQEYQAVPLRSSTASGKHLNRLNFKNIGKVKGFTFERVLIYPTQPMLDLMTKGKYMADKSACLFYVGVTRAKSSVAIIVNSKTLNHRLRTNPHMPVTLWCPDTLF